MFSSLRSALPADDEIDEVFRVFSDLFKDENSALLPSRVRVTPYVEDAQQSYFRDLVKPWEEVQDARAARTYSELFDQEKSALYRLVPIDVRKMIVESPLRSEIESNLRGKLRSWSDWIATDMMMILTKRIGTSKMPSRIEDLFLTYRAGYMSYGWTGGYPDDVHFLAFSGVQ